VSCENHSSEEKFSAIYSKQPDVIVGKYVRLEALDASKHLVPVYAATSGDMCFYKKSYDPAEVWGFVEEGPFSSAEEMRKSFVFQHFENEAAFALVQNLSDRILGVVKLTNDDPANLKIQLELPLIAPSSVGGQEELEACFLLMDRLYAHGYRRIQLSIDDHHYRGSQLADRLGFTEEGIVLKDMLIKEASRDSKVYGMLNSDWDKGAKYTLFSKMYGAVMTRYVNKYNEKEEELDEQQRVLADRKLKEEKDA
jgi:RimJ/RimL family protein N-acetyltransferase